MANYTNLKDAISAVIKQNGRQEITGQILQNSLLTMIEEIGENYTFVGVAEPETNPHTPDQNVFYIAYKAGIYANFGGADIKEGLTIFTNPNDVWQHVTIPFAGAEGLVNEIQARKDADESLSRRINGVSSLLNATALGLQNEITNRENADKALDTRVTNNEEAISRLQLAPSPTYYENSYNLNVFSVTPSFSSTDLKEIFTTSSGVATLPTTGDVFEVYENSNIIGGGVTFSYKREADVVDLLLFSNNLEDNLFMFHHIKLSYNDRQGFDTIKVTEAQHVTIDPSLIDEQKLTALYARAERTEKEINEYNISSINGLNYPNLQSAINALNAYLADDRKKVGVKVTFVSSVHHKAETWMYQGGAFASVASWSNHPLGGYNRTLFESLPYVKLNESTGFYEYADIIKDITEKEMSDTYFQGCPQGQDWSYAFQFRNFRFNLLPNSIRLTGIKPITNRMFSSCSNLIVANIGECASFDIERMFVSCHNLVKVIGILAVEYASEEVNAFYECKKLEYIHIEKLKRNLSFKDSPLLSVDDNVESTLGHLVAYSTNSSAITITLHHDAFVRVPQSLIEKAKAKQISFADASVA